MIAKNFTPGFPCIFEIRKSCKKKIKKQTDDGCKAAISQAKDERAKKGIG